MGDVNQLEVYINMFESTCSKLKLAVEGNNISLTFFFFIKFICF